MTKSSGSLFVVSAPSGAGKTTLCQRLVSADDGLRYSISYTSRPPREGEVHGRDYNFVSRPVFEEMIEQGRFVEWAEVYGNLYGTAREEVEGPINAGFDLLFDVDIQGGRKIKAAFSEAVLIFVAPPSLNELANRLKRRNKDSEEILQMRLKESKEELQAVWHYDYVVVNDQFEEALERMKAIITAERCRVVRRRNVVETLLQQPIPSLEDAE